MRTDAQIRASVKYNRKKDSITIRPTKEEGARIRQAAVDAGESVSGYIMKAVDQRIERDRADAKEGADR